MPLKKSEKALISLSIFCENEAIRVRRGKTVVGLKSRDFQHQNQEARESECKTYFFYRLVDALLIFRVLFLRFVLIFSLI